jgi:predicted outer membrane repeat protein
VQSGTLSLSGVTVQHGNSGQGGGIAVDAPATLNLTDGAVSHNTASGPGGGIYSQGVVSLIRSTVDNNQAVGGNGGGVATDGTNGPFLHVEDSTISDNTSTLAGGGISVGPGTSLALMNTTVAGNSAPGGGDALEFRASNGSANLLNTILAGSGHAACAGTSNALFTDHLLATDKTCPFPTANGDRVGDPKLGVLTDNGGPTETRAIDDTSPAFDAGDDQTCLPADQRGLDRPQGAHCDIGAFEAFVDSSPPPDGTPTPTPTPTPRPSPTPTPSPSPTPGPTPLPPPVYGTTFNAEKSKGLVRYRKPGSKKYVTLKAGAQLPKGTLVDTTKGRVTLTSADQNGKTQHAWFYEGIFKIGGQTKGKKPVTLLDLAGPKPQCGSGAKKSAVAARKRRSRHLWGSGKGRFRTTGQFSSATVRGTIWLTQDSCQGTLVKVKRGIVAVDDFTKHRTFLVKAGHSHLAKRRP